MIFLDQFRAQSFTSFKFACIVFILLIVVSLIIKLTDKKTRFEIEYNESSHVFKYINNKIDYNFFIAIGTLIFSFLILDISAKWLILLCVIQLIFIKIIDAFFQKETHRIILSNDTLQNITHTSKTYKIEKMQILDIRQNQLILKYSFERITIISDQLENGHLLNDILIKRIQNKS